MDNPNFGSSHLSSPALVVFSQAANGLSDALRLQRPFHSQLQDAKDLHHLSLVSSYGTHLLHGFQPHFLHQHLNPAVSSANSSPFGSGGAFVKPFPSNLSLPSAFAPPKCLGFGLDQVSIAERPYWSWSRIYLTDKSSPNLRAYCSALAIVRPLARAEPAANHSEPTLRAQHVLRCHHQQKTSRWKDTQVKKVIGTESAVPPAVPRLLALEVSEPNERFQAARPPSVEFLACPHFVSFLMENHLTHSIAGQLMHGSFKLKERSEQHKTILELLVFHHVCSVRKVIKSLNIFLFR